MSGEFKLQKLTLTTHQTYSPLNHFPINLFQFFNPQYLFGFLGIQSFCCFDGSFNDVFLVDEPHEKRVFGIYFTKNFGLVDCLCHNLSSLCLDGKSFISPPKRIDDSITVNPFSLLAPILYSLKPAEYGKIYKIFLSIPTHHSTTPPLTILPLSLDHNPGVHNLTLFWFFGNNEGIYIQFLDLLKIDAELGEALQILDDKPDIDRLLSPYAFQQR